MKSVPVPIQAAIIHHLIRQTEEGNLTFISSMVDMGFTPEQIDKLRSLTASEMARLFREDRPIIHIKGDGIGLEKALKSLSSDQSEYQQQAEFIRRGASASMMFHLFRLNRNQVTKIRLLLGLSAEKKGRPALPAESVQNRIFEAWKAVSQHSNMRVRYLKLHDQFTEIPISTLYAVISTDDIESDAPTMRHHHQSGNKS